MTLYLKATLDDGSTVVVDNASGSDEEFVLKPGQWATVYALPHDQQRAQLDVFVAQNAADPTGGRTERDERARETAANAATGEAHQDAESR